MVTTRSRIGRAPAHDSPWARTPVTARVAAACLALAALSLLLPTAPTYDPWAWIIWGREILHLDLDTVDGPSWKPLPVLFTTPFALFGDFAPELWVLVARAGALGGVAAAYVLGRRLAGTPAGVLAAASVLLVDWTLRNAGLGNSEGLLVLFVLWAAERHLARHHTHVFALGVAAGLLRPEVWPFLALYAAWLVWADRRRLPWVAGGLALLPLLWLVPEQFGSGNFWRAADRAQNANPDSPAFADRPALAVLGEFFEMLPPVAICGLVALVAVLVLRAVPREKARDAIVLGTLAGAWVALVAVMTEAGFAGNQRYLIAPAALTCVVGAAALVWLARALAARRPQARTALAVAVAAVATAALVADVVVDLPGVLRGTSFQVDIAEDLPRAIAQAGGPARVEGCGLVVTNPYLVQMVAWELERHGREVGIRPTLPPAAVLRARHTRDREAAPTRRDVRRRLPTARTTARTPHWEIMSTCAR